MSEEIRNCPQCSGETRPGQNFCGGCGASVISDPGAQDPHLGQVIADKYLLERQIGAGSVGVVYRAKQVTLNKNVAIKILRRRLVSDELVLRRFKQEARAASRLNHPNSIQILDFGQVENGELFMAMEYVEGEDLGNLIRSELPMSAERIARILIQVCSALYEAHSNGIIHRDLKPANILVSTLKTQQDFVKVCDFGIAKVLDAGSGKSLPVTRHGYVCGTPAYMSPEQVQGFDLDHRSDIFSLGVVLYQLLSGTLPFKSMTSLEMATKIVMEDPVHPSAQQPKWPVHSILEEVCKRAMAKMPGKRFQTALEMLAALQVVLPISEHSGEESDSNDQRWLEASAAERRVLVSLETQTELPVNQEMVELPPTMRSTRAHDVSESEDGLWATGDAQPTLAGRGGARTWRLAMALVLCATLGAWLVQPASKPVASRSSERPAGSQATKAAPPPKSSVPEAQTASKHKEGKLKAGTKGKKAAPPPASKPSPAPAVARKARASVAPRRASKPVAAKAATVKAQPKTAPAGTPKERANALHREAMKRMSEGDAEGAIERLKAAAKLAPRHAPLYRELGRIYMRKRDHQAGIRYYEKYVSMAPSASDAETYRTIIKAYR